MKRLWIVFALVLACAGLCGWGWAETIQYTDALSDQLAQAQKAANDGDEANAYQLSQQANADWQHAHNVLCTFLPHARLETISQTLALLPELARHGAREQFTSECARGIVQVQNLKEGEVPALQNIL